MNAQVRIESLVKEYGTLRALNGISFHIQAGEWVALMGPSGSGKTTLINILGGLDTLTSGHVIVDGVDLAKLSENDLVRYRAEKIGFVFQQFHLVPYLSALENVMLAQYFHSVTDEAQAEEALKRVGLGHRLTHLPSQLSGGEQQRVAIARALINQPKLILADEPTGNLDEANEEIVIGLFRELHSAGHTILMVTHDPDIAQQADRKIELVHGHLAVDQRISMDDGIHFDHLLEQIWVCGEEGRPSDIEHIRTPGGVDPVRTLARMEDLRLVKVLEEHLIQLTDRGKSRARDVVRRHRLAERLFKDTFRIDDHEAHSQACKFEHIISPELDQRICSFLGHPTTCPHGNPIPPGECCDHKKGNG
ncbi:MAG TPA: ATP-binding cassette domain-containing protein [Candidatus Acidoferrum sp.]|nr:ATP-binding cassette domain-containing protein [Candidatus Acidoferrum sp.]